MTNNEQEPSPLLAPHGNTGQSWRAAISEPPAWLAYALAVALTLLTLAARLALGLTSDEPLLELFLAPISIAAYLGGLMPALLATLLATLLAPYFLLPPTYSFAIASEFDMIELSSLIVAGTLIGVLSESLHRSRRRAEASRRLQAITLASIGDAIITTDAQGRVTFLNAEAERLTGWQLASAVGQPLPAVFQIVNSQTRAPVEDPSKKVLRTGTVISLADHTLLIGRDGRETSIDDSSAPIRQANGSVEGVVLIFRDIADRQQAEQALHRSERTLKLFVEHAPAAIAMLDRDMIYVAASRRYLADYHVLDQSIVGRSHYEVFPDIPERWKEIHRRCLAGAIEKADQDPFPRADGTLDWVRWEIHPWYEDSAEVGGLILFSEVITERKRVEQALEDERALLARRVEERTADLSLANAELARAARLKDEFLASMSHELRTPLNSVLGRSEILLEEIYGPLTPKQVEALRGIEESGRHLLALINDILDLSKIEADRLDLQIESVAVAALCRMGLSMVAQTALQKNITVTSSIDSRVKLISVDERRLKQILVNLLSNAVKFTPEGGSVGLEVKGDLERQAATFTIWDTGIGIAEADMPRLFKPFVQIDSSLSRQYTGTGLGLALVLRLTQAQGGSVALESTLGQGSRFSVTLPWNSAEPGAMSIPSAAVSDTAAPTVHQALIIEDSPTAGQQLARYLAELGARVELHTQGRGAVERAIELQPDVIVLDILLPDLIGWEVLRRLKAEPRTQAIPVVIVSVVDEPQYAVELGAVALLVKPIDRATLIQTLQRVGQPATEPPVQMAMLIVPPSLPTRILLAEDNQANIDMLQDYLRAKDYDVVVARTGSEVLLHAQAALPAIVLMDIQMPDMDGLEAIRRMRTEASLRDIPIIALTALAMPGDRERCLEAGADGYLGKPVNLRKLLATIEARLQPRRQGPDDRPADDPHPDN